MKRLISIANLITICLVLLLSQSCKKSSTTPKASKGCNDPDAVNYNANAKGTDCTYPSDKLAGVWHVSEFESTTNTTITYTATITKVDNKTINIKHNSDYPSTPPAYHLNNLNLEIHWSDKTFVPNGTITGTISNLDSKWAINYTDSITTLYKVKQTYTK